MPKMISYAQNGEDVILRRIFGDQKTGRLEDRRHRVQLY